MSRQPLIFDIYINSRGRVHDPDCRKTISIAGQEEVKWFATSGGPFEIRFPERNPFPNLAKLKKVKVRPGKPVQSGPAGAGTAGPHKYEVWDVSKSADGERKDDPDVLIEN